MKTRTILDLTVTFRLLLTLSWFISAAGVHAALPIPDKTVVLTFDDSVKSHRTFVAPLLKELGFGATFFVTHKWMDDAENFLSWQDIAEIHAMGFEIGNHSWTHSSFHHPADAARLEGELALVDLELKKVGVPKPVSFGYPGNAFGPEAVAELRRLGYRFARRGMQPETPYGAIEPGTAFDPATHDPLLIPSAGDAYPDWTPPHFERVVSFAREGKAAIVQFHGIPDVAHPWVHTPPDRFREYLQYLKEEGFHVIALRDLAPYLEGLPVPDDPMVKRRHPEPKDGRLSFPPEVLATRENLTFWLDNMLNHHGFSVEEAAVVCGYSPSETEAKISELKIPRLKEPPKAGDARIKALPYPGGRHPRMGFLDGAINPQRGTKLSLFPPWENGGYVVLDLPEAIFSNLGLTFLAHTHIPTIWDATNKIIDNVDWTVLPNGDLKFERSLPNGIHFGASVKADETGADLELWLENGTSAMLSGMRTQICAMLKGAPGFEEQSNDRKVLDPPVCAVRAKNGDRWILMAFDRCGRAWGNPPVPCMHSDPILPEATPGERVSVKGRFWFYEGKSIEGEVEKARQRFSIVEKKT